MNKAIIIGGGLGGLACGLLLQKNGYRVSVLEHDARLGGCLQSFQRNSALFDTGLHYVGGLGEGGPLHPLFQQLGLIDLPWKALDKACFDRVCIGDRTFAFAQGYEHFYRSMVRAFPHESEGLRIYTDTLQQISQEAQSILTDHAADVSRYFGISAYQWLCDTIHDPLLRDVLCGTSLKMELRRDRLPLFVYAEIQSAYIHSAHRLRGGGHQLADRLEEQIVNLGGEVLRRATVSRIIEEEGRATGVVVNGVAERADVVVSAIHPASTMALLSDTTSVRPVYRRRLSDLENSYGMFTCNLRLKPGSLAYQNRNLYIHRPGADMWDINTDSVDHVLVHFYPGQDALDILTPMRWADVSRWADAPKGKKGEDYVAFKRKKADECIMLAETQLPNLLNAISHIYSSTPLTYRSSLLTPEGTAYGVMKDWQSPLTTVLSPRTPLQGLYLTGQHLHLHGILGTTLSAFLTAQTICS